MDSIEYIAEIDKICEQLCRVVDMDFNFTVTVESTDLSLQKFGMLINFLLDCSRRSIENEKEKNEQLEQGKQQLQDLYSKTVSQEDYKNAILANAPNTILTLDEDYNILSANLSSRRIFKVSYTELIGKNLKGFIRQTKLKHFTETSKKNNLLRHEETELMIDGNVVAVEMNASTFFANKKKRYVFILKDLSEMKGKEKHLIALQKEHAMASRKAGQAEIASNILHNVGNILNSMNVNVSTLTEKITKFRFNDVIKGIALLDSSIQPGAVDFDKSQKIIEYFSKTANFSKQNQELMQQDIERINESIDHIKAIVKTQQKYARFSAISEAFNVNDLLDDILDLLGDSFSSHHVKVLKAYSKLPEINIDKHKLMMTLINLMNNAKDAIDESENIEGEIFISTLHNDDTIHIILQDNGVGIAPENLQKIFTHGFTTKDHGNGFGMHSCANALGELKGTINIDSEGLGHGATVTIILPVNKETDHADLPTNGR